MVDITEISAMVAAVGVLIGVAYYILDMRNQTRIRKTDLVTELSSTFNSKEFSEAIFRVYNLEFREYEDFEKKYGRIPSVNQDQIAIRMVTGFYEQVGMLLRKGLVEPDLVFDLFLVSDSWEKLKPLVIAIRKRDNQPTLLEWYEYLYNEQQKYEQKLQKGVRNG